jgi:DNA-binding GntR family transcriptional regulator
MDSPTDDPRSPYLRIADDIRRSIALGTMAPGAKLPSNADLKRRYDVASQTAQNAINALKAEGLVYGVAGKGVFVRSDIDIDSVRDKIASAGDSVIELNEVLIRLESLEAKVADLQQQLDDQANNRAAGEPDR